MDDNDKVTLTLSRGAVKLLSDVLAASERWPGGEYGHGTAREAKDELRRALDDFPGYLRESNAEHDTYTEFLLEQWDNFSADKCEYVRERYPHLEWPSN